MMFHLRTFGRHLLGAMASATLQAWIMVLCIALSLSMLRAVQIAWHWPESFHPALSDLWAVAFQGARFDLKVCAAAAILLWPALLITPARWHGWLTGGVTLLFITATLINLHYFGFYKTPIDPVVFGFFEDDTQAIIQTIWSDFPVLLTLAILIGSSWAAMRGRKALYEQLSLHLNRGLAERRIHVGVTLLGVLLALFLLALSTKGTLRAMALGRQNVSVTTSQFLNDMVPNGVIALKFAWDGRRDSQNFTDPLVGLKRLGFASPMEAARTLGMPAENESSLRTALLAGTREPSTPTRKNLLFFLMESWSAEPFLYHDPQDFNVLGRLAPTMDKACHFSNFDAVQPGTHPALEAILFSSPITPLTLGPQGKRPIPWAIPLLLKQAGYRTVFVTSARSGWRDLDRVLKVQGFDEVIDANSLRAAYPEASLGIWGVWDSYVFRYLSERLKKPQDQPLFIFVLTATNHPPYDLPPDYRPLVRKQDKWGGERNSQDLWPNLDTWHYATDLLGGLVQEVQSGLLHRNTLMAATGDHNVRSFGLYASPERRPLARQVPFVVWGDQVACGRQQTLPASHRDMFPTLLPLLGLSSGYLMTGRNLLADPARQENSAQHLPISLSYFGPVRTRQGSWSMGDPASFMCTATASQNQNDCRFDDRIDAIARAQLGLLDWSVRSSLRQ